MTNNLKSISLVLPFYDEALNAGAVIAGAAGVLDGLAADYEIIAVDDGSVDGTAGILDRLAAADSRIKPVHHARNQGYGMALRSGITAAKNDWLLFCDGDGQFPPEELKKFLPYLPDYPVVLGFRIDRQDPWHRKLNSYIYNQASRFLLGARIRDLNCAMKAFHRSVFKDVRFRTCGQTIYLDVLSQVFAGKTRFVELGVRHLPRAAGSPTGARPGVILKAMREYLAIFAEEFPRALGNLF